MHHGHECGRTKHDGTNRERTEPWRNAMSDGIGEILQDQAWCAIHRGAKRVTQRQPTAKQYGVREN